MSTANLNTKVTVMNKNYDVNCVSICGLFCGACPAYPHKCHGCLSDFLRESCRVCKNGFRQCAAAHSVTHCYLCQNFPCDRIEKFSQGPFIDGINNHANVIADSQRLRQVGQEKWLKEQAEKFTCTNCNQPLTWYNIASHSCNERSKG